MLPGVNVLSLTAVVVLQVYLHCGSSGQEGDIRHGTAIIADTSAQSHARHAKPDHARPSSSIHPALCTLLNLLLPSHQHS